LKGSDKSKNAKKKDKKTEKQGEEDDADSIGSDDSVQEELIK